MKEMGLSYSKDVRCELATVRAVGHTADGLAGTDSRPAYRAESEA